MKVWVLSKGYRSQAEDEDPWVMQLGVYETRDDMLARVDRIATRNSQYKMTALGENDWIIGPTEDEGFFGHKPVRLTAREVTFYAAQ